MKHEIKLLIQQIEEEGPRATAFSREECAAIIALIRQAVSLEKRIDKAIELAVNFGGFDGSHHKTWVIDQMVRKLAGRDYKQIVRDAKAGPEGPETYSWDEGTPP